MPIRLVGGRQIPPELVGSSDRFQRLPLSYFASGLDASANVRSPGCLIRDKREGFR